MTAQLEAQFQQGALHFRRLTFTEAVMIIVGGNVGAAILSLPYAARASGYLGAVLISWSPPYSQSSLICISSKSCCVKVPGN